MTDLGNLFFHARAGGALTVHIARTRVYGMRPRPQLSASNSQAQTSALGIGPRSVYKGPTRAAGGAAQPGAPMLKRWG